MTRLACTRLVTLGCLSLIGLSGCGSDEPGQTGTVPEQLEALQVAPAVEEGGAIQASGTLAITGQDREYTLSVTPEGAATIDIALHSPALSPLAALHDKAVEVELGPAEMGGRSLAIRDEAGPVYVATAGDGSGVELAEKALGAGFATWGAEVGTETDGTFVWSYKKAVLAGDGGPVEVLPGEVATVEVDGATWRVVVIASYTVGTNPDADALPACSPEDMLAFEALRVEAAAEEEPVRRLADAQVAYIGCTAPGGGE
jgi:hypothetical protein